MTGGTGLDLAVPPAQGPLRREHRALRAVAARRRHTSGSGANACRARRRPKRSASRAKMIFAPRWRRCSSPARSITRSSIRRSRCSGATPDFSRSRSPRCCRKCPDAPTRTRRCRPESRRRSSRRKRRPQADPNPDEEIRFDAAFTFSPRDVLRFRDFESMTAEELAAVRAMLARMRLPLPELPTRRTMPAARGTRVDLRATMRRATGGAGSLAPLALARAGDDDVRRWWSCATSPARWTAIRECSCTSCMRSRTTAIACTSFCSARG